MSTTSPIPFSAMGTVDDLLDRAREGSMARTGLEAVKRELTKQRDAKYRQLLNAPDTQVLQLRAELKAIESLAQSLLVKEAQGEVAVKALYTQAGLTDEPAGPQGKRGNRQRKRPTVRG